MTHALFPHDRNRSFGDDDNAEEIRFDLRTEIGERRILDRADITVTGIIDQYVQPAKGFNGGLNGMTRRAFVSHVKRNGTNLITV